MCGQLHIAQLYKDGRKFVAWPLRVSFMPADETQVLVWAPKSLFKHATDRNRLRRLMREAWRLNNSQLKRHYKLAFNYIDTCLILEDYEHAKARGAKIYAELVGFGATSDAYHMTAPDPSGDGAIRVMRMALEDAQVKPEEVDFINTHGTSTPLGDVAELKAIKEVFGEHVYSMNLDSTKSMTGHLVGAAGAIEAFACVKALEEGIVPPTINHEEGDEDENIDYRMNFTFNKAQRRDLHFAMSNNFGFGGLNACLFESTGVFLR